MKKVGFAITLFLVLGLVLAACATPKAAPAPSPAPSQSPAQSAAPAAPQSEWDKVIAAAKKEGTVTIYTSQGVEFVEALKAGMKPFGINVEMVGGNGGELQLKVETEQRAKAYVDDLFISGSNNQYSLLAADLIQPLTVALPNLKDKDAFKVEPASYEAGKTALVFGLGLNASLAINTDLVKRGEIASWQDMVDSKWRDKIVMSEPRAGSGPGSTAISFWGPALGEDFWKKMAAQRITMQRRYDSVLTQVAYGEKAVAVFPASAQLIATVKSGAPVQIVHLKEGTLYYRNGVALIKNAPHPNAALVLINWMFTKEAQIAIGKALGNFTVRKDVTEQFLAIPELNTATFTMIQPAADSDSAAGKKGAEFSNKIFGAP